MRAISPHNMYVTKEKTFEITKKVETKVSELGEQLEVKIVDFGFLRKQFRI